MEPAWSPAQANGIVKVPLKRPRPVLSCLECRRKKLKCSRTIPCSQCTKTGYASRCSYNDDSPRVPSEAAQDLSQTEDIGQAGKRVRSQMPEQQPVTGEHSAGPSTSLTSVTKLGIIEDLQSRVEKLEYQLKFHAPKPNHLRHQEAGEGFREKGHNVSSGGFVRLKGSATRYHGQNQKVALLNHFEEARAFMKKLETGSDNPSLVEMRNDLVSLQQSWSLQTKSRHREQFQDNPAVLQRMVELLPSRIACEKLIAIYFDNFEHELRVLHKPSLLSAFAQLWESQTTNPLHSSEFIPQMLAVLAIASSLDHWALIDDEASRGHGMASTYCDLVENWLEGLKGKQRLKFSTLQTQTLLLMAKQTSLERVKDMWNATGSLVRSAMTIGLHRDPSESLQIPVFWAELRRRLWFTIVEMDLQISLTCGMPTMVSATDFTCGIPANVNDTDLSLESRQPPPPRSFDRWSDCLPQVVLAKSLRQRLNAARLLSDIEHILDYDDILEHAKKLERNLRELPAPLKFDYPSDDDSQRPGRLMARVILDVHIRRAILNLYGPFAQADLTGTNFAEARLGFIDSSLAILCYQDLFDPHFADLDIVPSPRYWDLFYVCCKNDMMHASLGVCLEIQRWSGKAKMLDSGTSTTNGRLSPYTLPASDTLDPIFTKWTKPSLTKTVEDNMPPLMRRLDRFGSDPKDLLCLSIVLNSVRTNQSPDRKEVMMESGVRELIKAYQQHHYKTRINKVQESGSELSGNQLTPLSQTDTNMAPLATGVNFGFLTDADFDLGEIDFGFAQDWQLDQTWD